MCLLSQEHRHYVQVSWRSGRMELRLFRKPNNLFIHGRCLLVLYFAASLVINTKLTHTWPSSTWKVLTLSKNTNGAGHVHWISLKHQAARGMSFPAASILCSWMSCVESTTSYLSSIHRNLLLDCCDAVYAIIVGRLRLGICTPVGVRGEQAIGVYF